MGFVESIRAGFVPATRRKAFALLARYVAAVCPLDNLPERKARTAWTGSRCAASLGSGPSRWRR
jgi:hypothetical protein